MPCYFTKGKGKGRYSSSWGPHLRATRHHLPYGITQCYLPRITPAMQAGTRFTYPGQMESWVDLIAPRPGVKPATFRSRVQRCTTKTTIYRKAKVRGNDCKMWPRGFLRPMTCHWGLHDSCELYNCSSSYCWLFWCFQMCKSLSSAESVNKLSAAVAKTVLHLLGCPWVCNATSCIML